MKKKLLLILLLICLLVGCSKTPDEKDKHNDDFTFKFLKLEMGEKNLIYSPLSIKYALSMLKEGASNNTLEEIKNVLKDLNLTKYSNYEKNLSLANAIYIKDSYVNNIKESYVNTLSINYNAEIHNDSFKNASNINNFIKTKTLGLIENLIDDIMVQDEKAKMVIINALAIDMEWDAKFDTNKTNGADFHLNDKTIKATTMHKKAYDEDTLYYKSDDLVALKMNLKEYGSNRLEFLAIMPENLKSYINDLKYEDITSLKSKMLKASDNKDGISISIPKFKYEYSLKLKEDLIKMGIKDAFNENADFSNMTSAPEGLYINDALHKAVIEFSEEGIKAAAVTAFTAYASAALIETKPINITFDKPFIYLISDSKTGEVWFVGTVYEPNLWENDKEEYSR